MGIQYRTYPYAGVSAPSEAAFYPVSDGESITFNDGYVFDYQSLESDENSAIRTIFVGGLGPYPIAAASYYVQITTDIGSSKVTSAEVMQGQPESITDGHHYSAGGLDISGDPESKYDAKSGTFNIKLCDIDVNGNVSNVYLRDNIHWQKTNYNNLGKDEDGDPYYNQKGLLYNWGDGDQQKFDNNSVEFRNIGTKLEGFGVYEEAIMRLEVTPSGNLNITTQIPQPPEDCSALLIKDSADFWKWDCIGSGVMYGKGDNLNYVPNPDSDLLGQATENSTIVLSYEGTVDDGNPFWTVVTDTVGGGGNVIPQGVGVMYGDGATYQFLPYPVGSNTPYVLIYDGANLDWLGSTGCP
ncbi:hypothetical protein N9955_00050 [bacterium]|nr:hypothetical protein [bacterium]